MLSYVVGEETFLRILREFYVRFKFCTATFDDFAKVAEEVSGQDLEWFVEQWVNTNKKLDYAIKYFSSKRVKQGEQKSFANQVVISQLGDAVMPLEVEAVLHNGERITKKYKLDGKIDTLSFITSSHIKRVILDPYHRLLDIDRYNNRKPNGFKFDFINFLDFSISNDEYYHVLLLPSFSHSEDHGWEYGIGLTGTGGFLQGSKLSPRRGVATNLFHCSLSYNQTRKAPNFLLEYSNPFLRKKDKAFVGGVSFMDKNGKRGGQLFIKKINYDDFVSLWGMWVLFLGGYEYYHLNYISQDVWQAGKTALLSFNYVYDDFNREKGIVKGLVASMKVDWGIKTLGKKNSYQKITALTQIYRKRILFWSTLGYINGSPFFQDKYDLASEGNFRGLPLHQFVGKNILAGGLESRIHTPFLLGVFPFVTFGNLPKKRQVYYEGGIGLGIGLKQVEPGLQFRIDFPFWEYKPLPGEKGWDWKRIYVRLGVPFESDQWYQWRKR